MRIKKRRTKRWRKKIAQQIKKKECGFERKKKYGKKRAETKQQKCQKKCFCCKKKVKKETKVGGGL